MNLIENKRIREDNIRLKTEITELNNLIYGLKEANDSKIDKIGKLETDNVVLKKKLELAEYTIEKLKCFIDVLEKKNNL